MFILILEAIFIRDVFHHTDICISVKIIERFHLLFVSDVRTVYENFVLFILDAVFFFC